MNTNPNNYKYVLTDSKYQVEEYGFFYTYEEAVEALNECEEEDKEYGSYEKDWYMIKEYK